MLALVLSVLHWCAGLGFITIFNNTKFINAVVLVWLFPFGCVAMAVNPHKMSAAAIGNSIFCGFVVVYALTFWLNRAGKTH